MKKNDFLIILYVSLFVVIIWIAVEFIRSRPQDPLKPNLDQLITPINPNFDPEVLSEIDKLPAVTNISPNQIIVTPTPSNTPTPSSQPSASPQNNQLLLNNINISTESALF